jgi:transcription-repair coupling factor (superfamily II helicase)
MTTRTDHPALTTGHKTLFGVPEGYDAQVLAGLAHDQFAATGSLTLHIARDDSRARMLADQLAIFAPELEVLRLPSWDCLPYDRVSPSATIAAERAAGLAKLAGPPPRSALLVITTASGALQRVAPRSALSTARFTAKPGDVIRVEVLEAYLRTNGYVRASTVAERGEYAVRGGVVDVFPPHADEPVRFDLFGDELESLRAFDPATQRTTRALDAISFEPASEILLTEAAISTFRAGWLRQFGAGADDPIYAAVSAGARQQGVEHYLPLFHDHLDTLFDLIGPAALVTLDPQALAARDERLDLIGDYHTARTLGSAKVHSLKPDALYLTAAAWDAAIARHPSATFSPFPAADVMAVDYAARPARDFAPERAQDAAKLFEAVVAHIKTLVSAGKRVAVASWTAGASERLGLMLTDHGLEDITAIETFPQMARLPSQTVARLAVPLSHGFETNAYAVIAETDILGERLARPRKKRRASNFIAEASALSPTDLVVHIDHGVGRYVGLKTLDVTGAPHDCLEVHYAGDAKLYLPVENIDLLTRYGADGDHVELDRLGSASWQNRKARAKKRLLDMAEGLIALAAARALKTTEAILPPSGTFDEFCARFPYEETDDQLSAIADVLEDLAKGQPMDRLICGDVGFGKTEVALRAAFVAAMTGRQVAIVCPTTLLCRQHFKTFTQRFAGWPVTVRQLSRLVTAKDATETRAGLANGQVDIVIATHAVLSDKVSFRDLGLMIVDEEQHFGVKHKEKLKDLAKDVHVLTLTATPIPRTLQMALTGIRDMSVIATPPIDRLSVRTVVAPFDAVMVREALLREKYRGGQSFVISPRIQDLGEMEAFIRDQVPEVAARVAHGQMAPSVLEDIMSDFIDGQFDVLISTTIVESGIDIPTANTLIINKAEQFGLAQLYQLRGRVGRAKQRAYAYLTTAPNKALSESAEKRLKVLQSLDSLGAGFQLASHDLDIRGGGNLLGDEQSGQIREVGAELYQQMLEDAVMSLKESGAEELAQRGWSPSINLGLSVLIPEDYVPDLNVRLALYRRLSEAEQGADREALAAELIDRFGPIPAETQSLLRVVGIKALCRSCHIAKIEAGSKGAIITFRNDQFPNPGGLVGYVGKYPASFKLRPDMKLVVKGEWPNPNARLKAIEKVLFDLAQIA